MATRKRMTWQGRRASSPPATPGYGTEDQDHPAHEDDPAYAKYKKGDPDAWAETPNPPPYPEGNPPADPGYDVEDQDHPAHEPNPRVPKEASLRVLVERKAAKCARIASAMLGKNADEDAIEDQSLSLMDLPDEEIDATLARMSGGFMVAEDEEPVADFGDDFDDDDFDDDIMIDDDEFPEEIDEETMLAEMIEESDLDEEAMLAEMIEESEEVEEGPMAAILATMEDLKNEVMSLKRAALRRRRANQNDPNGPSGQTVEQVQAEAEATTDDEVPSDQKSANEDPAMAAMFDTYDTDGDGFITTADWKGPRALFASLDEDGDGILSRDEVVGCGIEADDDEIVNDDISEEEEAMLAEMLRQAADDESEEEIEDSESEEAETASKKAGEIPENFKKDDDDESESEKKAAKKAAKKKACGDMEAEMFAPNGDPMGLADGGVDEFLPEDDALLAEIFGNKTAEDEDKEAEDDEDDEAKTAAEDDDESESDESVSKEARVKAARKALRLARMALKKAEDEDKEAEDDEDGEAKTAAEDEESEEEVEVEETEETKKEARMRAAKRQAALRPQPRKPNHGIKTIGGMARTAGARNEVGDLEQLWESAPDVSDVFGK